MTRQSFSLTPFPAPNIPNITITGNLSCQNNLLALSYSLAGNVESILMPSASAHPARKDELWKATCFEFFLALKDQPQYWEFNMSPAGDWNVYHMDAYRRVGFREETSIQWLQFEVEKARVDDRREGQNESKRLTLRVTADLSPILQPTQSLAIGIAAVIQAKNGIETYWALAHPAAQADFHLRESFTLAPAR